MKTIDVAVPAAIKSTNVRLFSAMEIWKASLSFASCLAPGMAARSAAPLLRPPSPRPISARARAVFDRADDRFTVRLDTAFGGVAETTKLSVTLWGRGPAVFMLHGWGGRATQWISFVEPLVQSGFTAVALDAPRHGDSRGRRTSLLHFAAALARVVDSVGPAHALVGHSLGGAAVALAMKQGLAAERAVLIGAPADPAEFFDFFLERFGVDARMHPSIRRDVERRYGFRWEEFAVTTPPRDASGAVVPALVVHDADDDEVDPKEADRIAASWPGARVMVTRGLGHQRILRDPDVSRDVVAWLRGDHQRAERFAV